MHRPVKTLLTRMQVKNLINLATAPYRLASCSFSWQVRGLNKSNHKPVFIKTMIIVLTNTVTQLHLK